DEHEDEEHHDEHEDEEHHHEHIHEHGEYDAHIWLDTFNAKVIANQITIELSKLDPNNRYIYQKNRDNFIDEVDALERTINQQLNHYVSFVTFHDAYQYFENRFDVPSAGALTVNPDVMPGAHQLTEIRDLISYNDIHCIFSEPQFNPKIIEVIADDTNVKMGVLDPLGVNIPAGKDQYFSILKNIANKLEECGHNH
ncbi:MAG: zinc ABC transporter substrate-binding protein, partial [Hyphomicrobiales bacterium]